MPRALLLVVILVGCKSPVSKEQQLCAKAGAMFEQCETFDGSGSDAALQKEIVVDRWRGLCRAVFTGETAQLMANARDLYNSLDDETKAGLKVQAECQAKATSCAEYAACDDE